MRKFVFIAAVAALLAAPAAQARQPADGEAKLAKILKGRVAGEPVSCINTLNTRSTRIIDKTAIVYDAGSVIYVNRPHHPESLDDDDVMVTRLTGSQLCNVDVVQLRDRTTGFYAGFVGLDRFVPYRRVARAN